MKILGLKLIIIFLVAITYNLLFPALAWGNINMGSLVHYKYDITNNHDFIEANLFLNSKINDDAYAYLSFQFVTSPAHPDTPVLNYSTFYFTYYVKPNLGTFTVGCYDNYLSDVILGSSIDKLKSNCGIKYERPIISGLYYNIGYFPNEIYNDHCAFTSGIRYKSNNIEADLNMVKFADVDPLCYTTNLAYKSGDLFKIYFHHCQDIIQKSDAILGVAVTLPPVKHPLVLSFEYNFNAIAWSNLYYGISYTVCKNITLSYLRYLRPSNENELRLSIKW